MRQQAGADATRQRRGDLGQQAEFRGVEDVIVVPAEDGQRRPDATAVGEHDPGFVGVAEAREYEVGHALEPVDLTARGGVDPHGDVARCGHLVVVRRVGLAPVFDARPRDVGLVAA